MLLKIGCSAPLKIIITGRWHTRVTVPSHLTAVPSMCQNTTEHTLHPGKTPRPNVLPFQNRQQSSEPSVDTFATYLDMYKETFLKKAKLKISVDLGGRCQTAARASQLYSPARSLERWRAERTRHAAHLTGCVIEPACTGLHAHSDYLVHRNTNNGTNVVCVNDLSMTSFFACEGLPLWPGECTPLRSRVSVQFKHV